MTKVYFESIVLSDDFESQKLKRIIEYNIYKKEFKRAASNYRKLGKRMIFFKNYTNAITYFKLAARLHYENEYHEKELTDYLNIIELLKNTNDKIELSKYYVKVANIYKNKMCDKNKASLFLSFAAKCNEENGNYFATHKMAWAAYECIENNRSRKMDMLNIAIRASIKQQMYSKIVFYTEELLKVKGNDNIDLHYLSTCQKGYFAAKSLNNYEKIILFLKPIIYYNVEDKGSQSETKKIAKDYFMAILNYERKFDKEHYELLNEIFLDKLSLSNIYNDLIPEASKCGLIHLESDFKIRAHRGLKGYYYENKIYSRWISYTIWDISSVFGENLKRWALVSVIFIFLFGLLYSDVPVPQFIPSFIEQLFLTEFDYSTNINKFTPFYFSTVTFTTLGFGDVHPLNFCAQFWVVIEVVLGYIMLGGLIAIFTKRIVR